MGLLDGRVVIVTGAGGGIGRAHALAFAAEARAWWSTTSGWALTVRPPAAECRAVGRRRDRRRRGEAVASRANIADWNAAAGLIGTAVRKRSAGSMFWSTMLGSSATG